MFPKKILRYQVFNKGRTRLNQPLYVDLDMTIDFWRSSQKTHTFLKKDRVRKYQINLNKTLIHNSLSRSKLPLWLEQGTVRHVVSGSRSWRRCGWTWLCGWQECGCWLQSKGESPRPRDGKVSVMIWARFCACVRLCICVYLCGRKMLMWLQLCLWFFFFMIMM